MVESRKRRRQWWPTLPSMLGALFVGTGCAAALHAYYSSLNSTFVGNTDDQQRALRIGTALAFFSQVGLVYSVHEAGVQWLWHEMKQFVGSFKDLNAAFTLTSDPRSFFKTRVLKQAPITSVLAFLAWLVPISSFIAPATLNVNAVLRNTTSLMDVPTLSIAQPGAFQRFTYAVNGSVPFAQKFLGPRTITTRFAVATATTGEILTIPPPATNASYEQTFLGPFVQCNESSEDVQNEMNAMMGRAHDALQPSIQLMALDYFAAIPALSNAVPGPVQAANLSNVDGALRASNQLWLFFSSYDPSPDFSKAQTPHYMTCELYNASYATQFAWTNGRQALQVVRRTLLNPVSYPANASSDPDSETGMAYSSVMWALSKQLTGSIGFYKDLNLTSDETQQAHAGRVYSEIASDVAQTVLIGSSDFNSHFRQNHLLGLSGNGSSSFSDQRLMDMGYAGNHTLSFLISELSSNLTLSLLSDPLLAPAGSANVTISSPANTYAYQSLNLVIAYTLAGVVALFSTVLGLFVLLREKSSRAISFLAIVMATYGIDLGIDLENGPPIQEDLERMLLRMEDGQFVPV